MNATKYLNFAIIVPFLFGIQSCQNESIPNQATSACPKEPTAKLENVKNVGLTSRITNIDQQFQIQILTTG